MLTTDNKHQLMLTECEANLDTGRSWPETHRVLASHRQPSPSPCCV